jgi:hypothetical protein
MKSYKKYFSTFVHTAMAILILLSLSSCNDDEDENPPRITIESPFENQMFSSTDTIEASAIITDNEQITSVELELLDLEFNQVAVKQSYPASGSTFNFGQLFAIDTPELQTGDYYLAFRANDGRNVGSAFVKIKINAIPRELEGVLVLTSQNNQSYIYYREEDESEFEIESNFFTDAVGGGLNYRQNIFATAGGEVGDADFFEIEEFSIINTLPGFGNTGVPFYLSMTYDIGVEQFILTNREGRVRVLDKNASLLLGFDGLENHFPLEVFPTEDGYFLSEKEIDGPLYTLVFYSFQGLLFDIYQVNGAIRGLFYQNLDEKFVWVDNPEGLELRILDISTEFLSLPYQRPGTRLADVVRTGNNAFIISTSEGLLRYNYSNGGTVIFNSSAPEGDLYFDDLNQLIYLSSGQDAFIYSMNGAEVGGFSFPREIVYIGFDYNR